MAMGKFCSLSAIMALALAGLLPGQRGPNRPGRMGSRGIVARPSATTLPRAVPAPRVAAASGTATDRFPIDRWNDMKPEQRERALAKLPPERQQKIRDQIARFNSLPEAEQQRLRERYRRLQQMPPDKQDAVRRELRQFNETPPERRRVLVREMRDLRKLSDTDRRTRMASDEYRARYSPDEQHMLEDLTDYLSPGSSPAPPSARNEARKD
jgi:hypothetical protein